MTKDDLYTELSGYAGLSALVSDRIYPFGDVPQTATRPYVSTQRISGLKVNSLGGYSGLENPRYQIDSWADTYDEAWNIALQVRKAMDAATLFKALNIDDSEDYETDTKLHRVRQDFSVWSKQA